MSHENQELQDLILLAMLPHVVFEGWSREALLAGVSDLGDVAGLGPDSADKAFPGGMSDVASHFSDWADRRMVAEMAKRDVAAMKIRERIATGVRCRLEILGPHREAVRSCLGFMALPLNAAATLRSTYKTVNEIWYAIGDESVDFNFYTKRASLAPVLGSTTLFWLADEGDGKGDFPATWEFLDRRIADVLTLIQARIRWTKKLGEMPSPLAVCKRFATAAGIRR